VTEHDDEREDGHLAGVVPGAGCTEIWEHLSEQRADETAVENESAEE
jgi:hypothetical protein